MQYPRFEFYPGDWLNDTANALLTYEQRGVHIELLCRMWEDPDCSLPLDDDAYVARLLHVTVRRWRQWKAVLVTGPHPVFLCEAPDTLAADQVANKPPNKAENKENPPKNARFFSKKLRKIREKTLAVSAERKHAAQNRWHQTDPEIPPKPAPLRHSHSANGSPNAMQEQSTSNPNALQEQSKSSTVQSPLSNLYSPDPEETHTPPAHADGPPRVDPLAAVVAAWNEVAVPPLPAVSRLTATRRRYLHARLAGYPDRDRAWWRRYFARVASAPFCAGAGSRGWRATFDWAIGSEEIIARVEEGVYDQALSTRPARSPPGDWLHESQAALQASAADRKE